MHSSAIIKTVKQKDRPHKRWRFKPIHFVILLIADLCVLAGVIVPQRSQIEDAYTTLETRTNERDALLIEYQRQLDNLEYMKTTEYQLQQGAEKYGYHYNDDTLISDDTSSISVSSGTASPTPLVSPQASPSVSPSASLSVNETPTPSLAPSTEATNEP